MSQDEIIRIAREAGFIETMPAEGKYSAVWTTSTAELECFAALIAAAERERLHDKFMHIHQSQRHSNNYWHFAARKIKEEA